MAELTPLTSSHTFRRRLFGGAIPPDLMKATNSDFTRMLHLFQRAGGAKSPSVSYTELAGARDHFLSGIKENSDAKCTTCMSTIPVVVDYERGSLPKRGRLDARFLP